MENFSNSQANINFDVLLSSTIVVIVSYEQRDLTVLMASFLSNVFVQKNITELTLEFKLIDVFAQLKYTIMSTVPKVRNNGESTAGSKKTTKHIYNDKKTRSGTPGLTNDLSFFSIFFTFTDSRFLRTNKFSYHKIYACVDDNE